MEEGEDGRTKILPTEKRGSGDNSCGFISAVMKLIVKRCRKANTERQVSTLSRLLFENFGLFCKEMDFIVARVCACEHARVFTCYPYVSLAAPFPLTSFPQNSSHFDITCILVFSFGFPFYSF